MINQLYTSNYDLSVYKDTIIVFYKLFNSFFLQINLPLLIIENKATGGAFYNEK